MKKLAAASSSSTSSLQAALGMLQQRSLPTPHSLPARPQQPLRAPPARAQLAQADTGRVVRLTAQPLTPEAFAPYGQVVQPTADGKPYDASDDAQLMLDRGTPR